MMNRLILMGSSVIIATAVTYSAYTYFNTRPEPTKCQYPPLEDSDVDRAPPTPQEEEPQQEERAQEERAQEERAQEERAQEEPPQEDAPCEHCLYTGPDQKPALVILVVVYFVGLLLLDLYLLLTSRP
jgi:hypothetical protein